MSDFIPPEKVIAKDVNGESHEIPVDLLRWRPSVYAILLQGDSVLLLPQHGRYDLPGGGVEFGEMLEPALERETYEETGLKIANPKLIKSASSFFKMPNAEDDYIQSIMLYYTADIVGGTLSSEGFDELEQLHVELAQWIPIKDLVGIELTSSIDWRPFVRDAAAIA